MHVQSKLNTQQKINTTHIPGCSCWGPVLSACGSVCGDCITTGNSSLGCTGEVKADAHSDSGNCGVVVLPVSSQRRIESGWTDSEMSENCRDQTVNAKTNAAYLRSTRCCAHMPRHIKFPALRRSCFYLFVPSKWWETRIIQLFYLWNALSTASTLSLIFCIIPSSCSSCKMWATQAIY